jgi:hypothetical protein
MGARHTRTILSALVLLPALAAAQSTVRTVDASRTVTLSLAEYNRLMDLASRPPQGAPAPPVPAVVSGADLRVRVDRDVARGRFTLNGNALRDGVSRVNLLSGATLIDASVAGRPLPLVAEGNAHAALVPGPGEFSLALEWGAPLTFRPGRASFVLPVPQAGTARATIDVPGEQADIRLSAGLITRRTIAGGRTIVEATLDPGSATEVWWSMRESAPVAAARELRTLADVMTLVTLGDSDVRMAALIDVTVVQGELRTVGLRLPAGYELTSLSGSTVETSEPREDGLIVTLGDPAARSHQVLVTLERPHAGGSFTLDTGIVTVRDVQRERGEIAVEGIGTLDLTVAERDGMQRIDMRELQPPLQSMARLPVLAAFRYQRTAAGVPGLALDVARFGDAGVLAAVADSAHATTLITSEGRALTEVVLNIQNRAQPFLKVSLPPGGAMVSVDVAGETAKPVLGPDGVRVPLLRQGFRPSGPYQVSFVYLHPGTPFARKGELQMPLPTMDIPVGVISWELFVPDRYEARAVGGNMLDMAVLASRGASFDNGSGFVTFGGVARRFSEPAAVGKVSLARDGLRGQIKGRVVDTSGAVMPGVTVVLDAAGSQRTAVTSSDGTYLFSGVPSGTVSLQATLSGFNGGAASLIFMQQPQRVDFELKVGSITEAMMVTANSVAESPRVDEPVQRRQIQEPPSASVVNLQRRAAGVLPVRIDVPRTGTAHRFVKPLVIDQEAFVTLRYRQR